MHTLCVCVRVCRVCVCVCVSRVVLCGRSSPQPARLQEQSAVAPTLLNGLQSRPTKHQAILLRLAVRLTLNQGRLTNPKLMG